MAVSLLAGALHVGLHNMRQSHSPDILHRHLSLFLRHACASIVPTKPQQLLELEREVVQGLVLRQPSLLARASEGLQGKVTAYADIFGEDVGQVSRVVWLCSVVRVSSCVTSAVHLVGWCLDTVC